MTQLELLFLHVSALFVLDGNNRLVSVNEPWDYSKPAPLIYVGKTLQSEIISYTRFDIPDETAGQISELAQKGIFDPASYLPFLKGPCVTEEELCYSIPAQINAAECVSVNSDNIGSFDLYEFGWLKEETPTAQPCLAYLADGKIVSVCRSVRIHAANEAHEAGIETAPLYKGKGCAKHVLAAWRDAVHKTGAIPLYSTLKTNLSSQRVAQKSGLELFAEGFHIGG